MEIENQSISETYKTKIAGFIAKKQLSVFLQNEINDNELKIALGFCRTKELNSLNSKNTFYFHAVEANNCIVDFPMEICESKRLILYSGGRNNPIRLTGYSGEIDSIQLKHKSSIKGKEQSKTEYYYEVALKNFFEFDEDLTFGIDVNKLFNKSEEKNRKLFNKFVPITIAFEKLQKSRKE